MIVNRVFCIIFAAYFLGLFIPWKIPILNKHREAWPLFAFAKLADYFDHKKYPKEG